MATKHVRSAQDELEEFLYRSSESFNRAYRELAKAMLGNSQNRHAQAFEDLRYLIGNTMTLSDLMGRKRMLMEADAVRSRDQGPKGHVLFSEDAVSPIVPKVDFSEAINDLIQREPRLAETAEAVADLYRGRTSFALAKSSELELTKRVQKAIVQAQEEGAGEVSTAKIIASIGDWTQSYAATVYSTNTASAYNHARLEQSRDDAVVDVIGALKFVTAQDENVRPNHAAAHGLIASQFDAIWKTLTPPLSWRCRCSLIMVDRYDLQRMGLIQGNRVIRVEPPNLAMAGPDPGFKR